MLVRNLKDIIGSESDIDSGDWNSRRLLLKQDKMGFSLHDTVIREGAELWMWYKNHLEAVYCIEGEGELVDRETGTIYAVEPGVIYGLDSHDKHILKANKGTHMRMVCVFNPPLSGREVHDEDGSYKLDPEA